MRKNHAWAAFGTTAAALLVLGAANPANAYTLDDTYSGGNNYYGSSNLDVIQGGTNAFEIYGVDASRNNSNQLVIQIYTNFAGAPASVTDGTTAGSLFLTSIANWKPDTSQPNDSTDTFTHNNGTVWSYAATSTGLYAIGAVGSANNYLSTGVAASYNTANGKITMSNVGGDPVSYPNPGAPGFYFRQGQAVTYTPNNPGATVTTVNDPLNGVTAGSTSVTTTVTPATYAGNYVPNEGDTGIITYTITDNGLFGDGFALAFAITCANDVIAGDVIIPPSNIARTPLPATALLMGSVLGAGGFVGRWRRRKQAKATV